MRGEKSSYNPTCGYKIADGGRSIGRLKATQLKARPLDSVLFLQQPESCSSRQVMTEGPGARSREIFECNWFDKNF